MNESKFMPLYIYVSDQGRVFGGDDEPTSEDFAYAEVGMVTILRVADSHCYRRGGTWYPVVRRKYAFTQVDGRPTDNFHSPLIGSYSSMISSTVFPNANAENRSDRSWTGPNLADARR